MPIDQKLKFVGEFFFLIKQLSLRKNERIQGHTKKPTTQNTPTNRRGTN